MLVSPQTVVISDYIAATDLLIVFTESTTVGVVVSSYTGKSQEHVARS